MDLERALAADAGLTCAVGAGGKKSTLYALADRLERAIVTATVRIPIFDRQVADVRIDADPVAALEGDHDWPIGVVRARERSDRYEGYDPETVGRLARESDAEHVLVKADGARTRLLKAPGEREPQLPAEAATVLALVSVRAVGRPLETETVHRPERVAAVTGRSVGATIEAADLAAVLTSPDGGLKGVPAGATYVPVLNVVDDDADRAVAREVATAALEASDDSHGRVDRVVLASMIADDPLVAVRE